MIIFVKHWFIFRYILYVCARACVRDSVHMGVLNRNPLIFIAFFWFVIDVIRIRFECVFLIAPLVHHRDSRFPPSRWFFPAFRRSAPLLLLLFFFFEFLSASNDYNSIGRVDWCFIRLEIDRFLVTVFTARDPEQKSMPPSRLHRAV